MGPERFRADIRTVKDSWDEIHDHGAAAFFLAQAYAALNEPQEALSLLRNCPLDEGFDPNGVGSFKALRANAAFRALEARVHREFPPVHHARVAFTVAETELFPEGIAADPARHVFYMGNQYHDKIIRATPAGAAKDFVGEGAYEPLGARTLRRKRQAPRASPGAGQRAARSQRLRATRFARDLCYGYGRESGISFRPADAVLFATRFLAADPLSEWHHALG